MVANNSLNNALSLVKLDARKAIELHQKALAEKPLFGWTQEKHDRYHLKHIAEARAVEGYCQVRQMQLDPD